MSLLDPKVLAPAYSAVMLCVPNAPLAGVYVTAQELLPLPPFGLNEQDVALKLPVCDDVKLTVPVGEFGLTVAVQVVDPDVPLVGLHVSKVVVAVTAETVSDPELVACPASPP